MKKLVRFTSAVLSAVAALSLAACGDDGDGGASAPDYDAFASEQVADAAAWYDAFAMEDVKNATYTVRTQTEYYDENNRKYTESASYVYKFDENKIYVGGELNGKQTGKMEVYIELGENNYMYMYNPNTRKWVKGSASDDIPDTLSKAMSSNTSTGGGNMIALREKYEDYVYDAEKKAYIYSEKEYGIEASIKIANGKFFGYACKSPHPYSSNGSMTVNNMLYDIGATRVSLPKVD